MLVLGVFQRVTYVFTSLPCPSTMNALLPAPSTSSSSSSSSSRSTRSPAFVDISWRHFGSVRVEAAVPAGDGRRALKPKVFATVDFDVNDVISELSGSIVCHEDCQWSWRDNRLHLCKDDFSLLHIPKHTSVTLIGIIEENRLVRREGKIVNAGSMVANSIIFANTNCERREIGHTLILPDVIRHPLNKWLRDRNGQTANIDSVDVDRLPRVFLVATKRIAQGQQLFNDADFHLGESDGKSLMIKVDKKYRSLETAISEFTPLSLVERCENEPSAPFNENVLFVPCCICNCPDCIFPMTSSWRHFGLIERCDRQIDGRKLGLRAACDFEEFDVISEFVGEIMGNTGEIPQLYDAKLPYFSDGVSGINTLYFIIRGISLPANSEECHRVMPHMDASGHAVFVYPTVGSLANFGVNGAENCRLVAFPHEHLPTVIANRTHTLNTLSSSYTCAISLRKLPRLFLVATKPIKCSQDIYVPFDWQEYQKDGTKINIGNTIFTNAEPLPSSSQRRRTSH